MIVIQVMRLPAICYSQIQNAILGEMRLELQPKYSLEIGLTVVKSDFRTVIHLCKIVASNKIAIGE